MTWAAIIALALAVGFLGMLVVGLLRSHAEIIRKLNSLGVRLDDPHQRGETLSVESIQRRDDLPAITGTTPDGDPLVVSPTVGSDPTLIAFLSTSCSSCVLFWEWIDNPTMRVDGVRYRVLVTTLGPDEESPTRARSLRNGSAEVVMSSSGWEDYGVPGAPYFVLIDPKSGEVVGEGTSQTVDALEGFLRDSAGDTKWDQQHRGPDRTDADRESMVDAELRKAGLLPGDPRLYGPGDSPDGDQ